MDGCCFHNRQLAPDTELAVHTTHVVGKNTASATGQRPGAEGYSWGNLSGGAKAPNALGRGLTVGCERSPVTGLRQRVVVRIRAGGPPLTASRVYDTVIHMEEIITIRVPKGTRRRLEKLARARRVTLSQYVRRALEAEQLLGGLEDARSSLVPVARARGVYTDEDVFSRVS